MRRHNLLIRSVVEGSRRISKINVEDLARGLRSSDTPHTNTMDNSAFTGLRAALTGNRVSEESLRQREAAARARIRQAQENASDNAAKTVFTASLRKSTAASSKVEMKEAPPVPLSSSCDDSEQVGSPASIREMFRESVRARAVANAGFRKYVAALGAHDYTLAVAAYDGCREGGLRMDVESYNALLDILLAANQLKAGMELYQTMTKERCIPNTLTYNKLMKLCLDKAASSAALRLYDEMLARGRAPNRESYELGMTAIAAEPPPVNWVKAVQIFEKATRGSIEGEAINSESAEAGPKQSHAFNDAGGRHGQCNMASASTYNALMKVYMSMRPFEWRVVYNCYYEMRNTRPKIPITWESYELVSEAMRRGEAGRVRRLVTFLDAWIQLTRIGTPRFIYGLVVYLFVAGLAKGLLGMFVQDNFKGSMDVGKNIESQLGAGGDSIPRLK